MSVSVGERGGGTFSVASELWADKIEWYLKICTRQKNDIRETEHRKGDMSKVR